MMNRSYCAEINLDNLRYNYRNIKHISNNKKIIGVIKADAYGHGAVECARVLEEEGVWGFAVAVISEAEELRRNGFKEPILILGYTSVGLAGELVKNDITQAVFDYELAQAISREAVRQNKVSKVHIKLDTGMGRIGFEINEDSIREIKRIWNLPNIKVEGIFSHFSTSDEKDKEFSDIQLRNFKRMVDRLEEEGIYFDIKHISNSAALIDMPYTYFDAVRPGIILYGYYPSEQVNKGAIALKPVMTLKAKIGQIKQVPKDTPISYGRRFYTQRDSIIATLPFGYADGYTRLLFEKGMVIAKGKAAPVVGSICMDQCMIDITDCPEMRTGDEVIVMGEQDGVKNDADDIAAQIGTINYEVLCMVSRRVPRVYTENGTIIKVKSYL